jgi:hypothetical protein
MEPVFTDLSAAIRYNVFKTHMIPVGLCVDLSTAVNFTVLSRYFNNVLKNPKSQIGWMFWKTLAVKNGGITPSKAKKDRMDYWFKLLRAKFNEIKKNLKKARVYRWRGFPRCQNCDMRCYPDYFYQYYYGDINFCNCEIVNCNSEIELILDDLALRKLELADRKKELLRQLEKQEEKMNKLIEKEKNVKAVWHLAKMKPAFQNAKENSRYKTTKVQAEFALKELRLCESMTNRERRNQNYKAPVGAAMWQDA